MPFSMPPILSTSEYEHLVLDLLNTISGDGSSLSPIPSILSTAQYRHLVLEALNYIATHPPSGGRGAGELWSISKSYLVGDMVSLNGAGYICTANSTGNNPSTATAFWTPIIPSSLSASVLTANIVNADSVTLTRGTVVYAFGATGNKLSVKRASNDAESTSSQTIGIINETVAPNGQGTITITGSVDQLSLGSPFVDGDALYLGTGGAFTRTKPSAPSHLVYVGVVERANAGNGTAFIKIQNGYELNELHDVSITTPLASQALVRNTANTLWINKSLAVADVSGAAPLAGPTLQGIPAAPTAAAATNTTQIATTAFVTTAVSAKANLASPTFTGTPLSTTAAVDTNTTQIATTAFVVGQGSIISPQPNGVAAAGSSSRYSREDHVHPLQSLPPFTLSAGTGSNSLSGVEGSTTWFNGQGTGYSSGTNGSTRAITILETCSLKRVSLTIQQATGGTTGTNGVLGIRNITTGVNYVLISAITTTANNDFENFSQTGLSVPFTAGDQYAWYYTGFSTVATLLRTIVTGYFYL